MNNMGWRNLDDREAIPLEGLQVNKASEDGICHREDEMASKRLGKH
jgi:hypothetical protein